MLRVVNLLDRIGFGRQGAPEKIIIMQARNINHYIPIFPQQSSTSGRIRNCPTIWINPKKIFIRT